ncbi:MAG: hypothetical protein AAF710_06105 [Planctomycetota bacterium]
MPTPAPGNARLVTVEEKIAHLERHLGELDGVVNDLFKTTDTQRKQIESLRRLVEGLTGGDEADFESGESTSGGGSGGGGGGA